MKQSEILKLEVQLLIVKYGKRQILEAIAAIEDVALVAIEKEIENQVAKAKRKKKQRRKKGVTELIQGTHPSDNDARLILERLAYRYDAKEFLPQLRDVKRFLESQGVPAGKLRSRLDALPKVIDVLAIHSRDQLQELVEESLISDRSDLGVITDQILGRGNNRHDN